MPLSVVHAEVFDPAISGEWSLPARLEITVVGMPEEPTHTDLSAMFTVSHYHWLSRIYSDAFDWDRENPPNNAVIYNTSAISDTLEPVVPVTVMYEDTEFGEDFFIKISRAKRLARGIERAQGRSGYEWLPDPTYLKDKKHGWYLQHANRMCLMCARTNATNTTFAGEVSLRDVPDMCKLYPIREHRLVALCERHAMQVNPDWAMAVYAG